ncbi:unnamed protein product [Fusarium langsethiae]|nr:unnamed protein product [Fusarium langsethiae]GKU21621.1 unnamed protein product [Fusarium langsethiae]
MPPRMLSHDAYRVGWICPLEVEQIAAMLMLDEEHEFLPQLPADHNVYKLGSINNHNVVIAGLHQPGNCPAATVVAQMRMTFPNLRYGLLVGIGGGVPVKTDKGTIRLGHVVVSEPTSTHSGAVQYDHGRAREGHFERTGSLAPPPAALLNAAQSLAVQLAMVDRDPVWEDTQRMRTSRRSLPRFKFPGVANDHLYQSDYIHQRTGSPCEGGCDPGRRIERPIDDGDESFVVVHRGTIASGELVVKDAKLRDRLAQQHGLLCFEMEAAGALADFPCIVIRGISDYCDSHKNDRWHGYAAVVAAAYARRLFFHMPIEVGQGPRWDPAVSDEKTGPQDGQYGQGGLPYNASQSSRFFDKGEARTLHEAAKHGLVDVVKQLLKNGADLTSRDDDGCAPINLAAGKGHEAVARLLLKKGANFEAKNNDGNTPLSFAALKGHEAVARLLLEKGARKGRRYRLNYH